MIIYDNLYVGKTLQKEKKKIINDFSKKTLQIGVYVIALPSNKYDVLDILPAFTLKYPIFKCDEKDIIIVGIAYGRKEALELAGEIALESYNATGTFKVNEYLKL